jgi:hypothetical protein
MKEKIKPQKEGFLIITAENRDNYSIKSVEEIKGDFLNWLEYK